MEFVSLQKQGFHFLIRDFDAGRIGFLVDFRMHFESLGVCGGGDELHDDFVADELFAAPILADEGEEAVFDFVPFVSRAEILPRNRGYLISQ